MNEMTAVLWITFLFALRFAVPIGLILGGGYLMNSWLEYLARHEKAM